MLEARSISRQAGDRWLLREVDLRIGGGERLALAGPSGAGKTVLLRALALLDPLTSGEVRWHGRSVEPGGAPAYRRRVAYLHQAPALAAGTVEANLRVPFGLGAHRGRSFDREAAGERLAMPAGLAPDAMIAIGHPGDPNELTEKQRATEMRPSDRKPLEAIICEGPWRG